MAEYICRRDYSRLVFDLWVSAEANAVEDSMLPQLKRLTWEHDSTGLICGSPSSAAERPPKGDCISSTERTPPNKSIREVLGVVKMRKRSVQTPLVALLLVRLLAVWLTLLQICNWSEKWGIDFSGRRSNWKTHQNPSFKPAWRSDRQVVLPRHRPLPRRTGWTEFTGSTPSLPFICFSTQPAGD